MKAAAHQSTWTEANQRYLAAEFARLKRRLEADSQPSAQTVVDEVPAAASAPAAIDVLTEVLGLSPFERDVLLLCAGVEMDAGLAKRCGDAQGHPQRPYATFGLALASLENPHWSALAPVNPLRRWRLIDVADNIGVTSGRLRIDERILHYLAGLNYLDARLQPLLRIKSSPTAMADAHRQASESILAILGERSAMPPAVLLSGNDVRGQGDVAAQVALRLGLQLRVISAEDLPQSSIELDAFAILWQREAALLGGALLVECPDAPVSGSILRLAEHAASLVFIAAREIPSMNRPTVRCTVDKPEASDQKRLWERALGPAAARLNGSLDSVASQFRLSAHTIVTLGKELRAAMAASAQPEAILWRACRSQGRSSLDDLAERLEPAARWDDLVLPEPQKAALHQIAAQVQHRLTVYQQWGFSGKGGRGIGISVLFTGESGTGKTMAAEVLANELHLDLYRIDLSSVVSKYIGETEKNLRRVFDAAEDSGAILLFDEADALFGKRSEVKDSHDRYANIEISYLLQRMEAYRGLAILTTNMKSALDSAFQRRLRFTVCFPFPDQKHREEIWRRIFPNATPVCNLDYSALARLQVAGGHIRNIAVNAAFLAAADNSPVSMAHLLQAAHTEAAKRERPLSDAETRGWS